MFPFAPSPHDDLRDLFGFQRAERTARNLGRSSITRGEGSLDLYETDDGPVTHRYGDLPDGSFGIGITHRGGFWNVSDLIGAGEDRDDGQDGRMDGHAGRIGAAEGRLDSHAGRIGSAEGRLDTHAGRIGATETKNSQQDTRLDSHVSRIGATENAIADAVSRLDAHASRIGAAENDAAQAQATGSQAAARAAKIINCINAVQPEGTGTLATASYSTMSTASAWQQLKNCLAS